MTDQELARIADAVGEHFRVERQVGVGGMASVYLAEDLKHRRRVAIKVLAAELEETIDAGRFEREIDTIAGLHHPHILPLHDSGRSGGLLYFVMPFVGDGSLRDRLDREGPLPVPEALRIAREAAEALAYAHRQGVVHRDIKPENIMLDSGHAVVSDFGVAVLLEGEQDDRITGEGRAPGTPAYMSPERADGSGPTDPRGDIYSLGCVLYEMLAGDPPFTGANRRAVMARKLVDPVPPLRTVREELPEAVERAVLKALARIPADRHRSAAELAEQLERLESEARTADARAAGFGGGDEASRSPARLVSLAALWAVGGGALLAGIGMVSTRVLDYKIQMPPMYSPSRSDYLVVGAQALIPFLVYGLVALGIGLLLRTLLPLTMRVTGRSDASSSGTRGRARRRLGRMGDRLASAWPGSSLADLFLVGMVAVSILVLWPFVGLYRALIEPGVAPLACEARTLHIVHYLAMPALIVACAAARQTFFSRLRRRRSGVAPSPVTRWASTAWLVVLLVVMALPWRTLWDAYYERAVIDGERAYVLAEPDAGLLAYSASSRSVRLYDPETVEITRRGIAGYLFEGPDVFASSLPRCTSIWNPTP